MELSISRMISSIRRGQVEDPHLTEFALILDAVSKEIDTLIVAVDKLDERIKKLEKTNDLHEVFSNTISKQDYK